MTLVSRHTMPTRGKGSVAPGLIPGSSSAPTHPPDSSGRALAVGAGVHHPSPGGTEVKRGGRQIALHAEWQSLPLTSTAPQFMNRRPQFKYPPPHIPSESDDGASAIQGARNSHVTQQQSRHHRATPG